MIALKPRPKRRGFLCLLTLQSRGEYYKIKVILAYSDRTFGKNPYTINIGEGGGNYGKRNLK